MAKAAIVPSGGEQSDKQRREIPWKTGAATACVTARRIGETCALLSGTARPLAHLAADMGYDSLANFDRQFRALEA